MNMQVEYNFAYKIQSYRQHQSKLLNYLISMNILNEINGINNDGNTILHWASTYDLLDIAKYLIDNGANINVYNKKGQTPLHLACFYGHLIIIDLLESNGADKNAEDNKGYIPLQYFMLYSIG